VDVNQKGLNSVVPCTARALCVQDLCVGWLVVRLSARFFLFFSVSLRNKPPSALAD